MPCGYIKKRSHQMLIVMVKWEKCEEISNVDCDKEIEESNNDKSEGKQQKKEYLPPVDWTWKGYLAWYMHGSMAPKL